MKEISIFTILVVCVFLTACEKSEPEKGVVSAADSGMVICSIFAQAVDEETGEVINTASCNFPSNLGFTGSQGLINTGRIQRLNDHSYYVTWVASSDDLRGIEVSAPGYETLFVAPESSEISMAGSVSFRSFGARLVKLRKVEGILSEGDR